MIFGPKLVFFDSEKIEFLKAWLEQDKYVQIFSVREDKLLLNTKHPCRTTQNEAKRLK